MRKLILGLVFLFLVKISYADIVLTEVMYNPTQASDTDAEWVEIYNNGTENADLSLWKIDGNNFADFTIMPGEFAVIARELVDGTDIDNESFETVYGNGDGVWNLTDGNFRAFDGDFSLTDTDKVNLSDGVYLEVLEYNLSFGGNSNGYSIEKIDVNKENTFDNWKESSIFGGSPGFGNVIKEGTKILEVNVEVTGLKPLLNLVNITDDSSDNGVQIRPKVSDNKSISVNLLVNSSLGLGNISKVMGELNGNLIELTKSYEVDSVSGVFNGNLNMEYFKIPGNYTVNLSVLDKFNESNSILVDFEYLSLLAISIDKNSVSFGKVEPGKSSVQNAKILNQGNLDIDLEVYGSNLESGTNKINASNLEYGNGDFWKNLDYRPRWFEFNLSAGINSNKDLGFKLNVPVSTKPNIYAGSINIVGVQK